MIHPEQQEMLTEAELKNYELYRENLGERLQKDVNNVLEQIRLMQAICEDGIENLQAIQKDIKQIL